MDLFKGASYLLWAELVDKAEDLEVDDDSPAIYVIWRSDNDDFFGQPTSEPASSFILSKVIDRISRQMPYIMNTRS